MTKEELAARLNGREYNHEIDRAEEMEAKKDGLVVAFGASDDLAEFRGAINDEVSCYDGGDICITPTGLLENKCHDMDCPYFKDEKAKARKIEAVWNKDGYSWVYETDIPHATFEILEDGEKYCRGIVFDLKEVYLRRKYESQPLLSGRYWTPAGAKDIVALCNEIDRLRLRISILEGAVDILEEVRRGTVLPE